MQSTSKRGKMFWFVFLNCGHSVTAWTSFEKKRLNLKVLVSRPHYWECPSTTTNKVLAVLFSGSKSFINNYLKKTVSVLSSIRVRKKEVTVAARLLLWHLALTSSWSFLTSTESSSSITWCLVNSQEGSSWELES